MIFGQQTLLRTWKVSRLQIALSLVLAAAGFLAVTRVRCESLIRQALRVPFWTRHTGIFVKNLMTADGASAETQVWLEFAHDCGYLTRGDI